jgi:hypothetical protein
MDGIRGWSSAAITSEKWSTLQKTLYEIVSVKIMKQHADLLPGCGASRTGHCGGVGHLRNG